MNRKQFLTLIVVGLVVGALGLYLANRQRHSFTASSFQDGQRVVADFPLNEVAGIRIQHSTNEVNLARGEVWTVKERWDYPANFSEISGFLRKVWELKPVQDVEAGPSQYGRLGLATGGPSPDAGTLVEFKDGKGADLRSLVLGKKQMKESPGAAQFGGGGFPVGRYVLAGDRVWMVNETFDAIEADPERWLNKDFIKVEKAKSVSVTSPNPTNTWALTRESENGEWKMAELREGEQFEASKASSLNYALSSPSFNDVVSPEATPDEIGMQEPTVAKLETFDGFLYTVQIGTPAGEENVFVKIDVQGDFASDRPVAEDETPEDKERLEKEFKEKLEKLQEKLKNEQRFAKWTYEVSKWTVDALLKPRSDFMASPDVEQDGEAHGPDDGHDHDEDDAIVSPIPTLPPELTLPPAN